MAECLLLTSLTVFHPIIVMQPGCQPEKKADCSVFAHWAWQRFPTPVTVVQLYGGLAVSHTISTTIDWQCSASERLMKGTGTGTVMPSERGGYRQKNEKRQTRQNLQTLWTLWENRQRTEGAKMKSNRPPSFKLFISLCCLFWSY